MSETVTLALTVNAEPREVTTDSRSLLVHMIRNDLGLTGTHVGCLTGDCGACTIELDEKCVKSCLVLAQQADGASITTIEGLAEDGRLSTLQQAFWDEYGFQCGYCLAGQLFAAKDLLERNPSPSDPEIRDAIDGNLCRCTGYENIVRAISTAAARTVKA